MTNEEMISRAWAVQLKLEEAFDLLSKLHVDLRAEGSDKRVSAAIERSKAEPAKVNLEQVRAAMTDLASAKGADAAKQLLAEYGAKKLGDVAPAKYASLLTDAKAWANE